MENLQNERCFDLPSMGQGGPPGHNREGGPQGQYPGGSQYPQQYRQPGPGRADAGAPGWPGYQPWPNQWPAGGTVAVAQNHPTAAACAAYYNQGQPQPQPGQMPQQPAAQLYRLNLKLVAQPPQLPCPLGFEFLGLIKVFQRGDYCYQYDAARFFDFIKLGLSLSPDARITAEGALNCSFFTLDHYPRCGCDHEKDAFQGVNSLL